jgi:predicted metalloprotease with PDZ domain
MKFLVIAALLASVTLAARAQMPTTPPPDNKDKPKPFAPVLVSQHQGTGRIGVRLVFEKDGTCLIGGLVRGGPAYDVGFRVGDTVIKIDKNLVSSLTPNEAPERASSLPSCATTIRAISSAPPSAACCRTTSRKCHSRR